MTMQALIAFLVAFPGRDSPSDVDMDFAVPPWERHPSEQRYLREKAREEQRLWARVPRSW